MRWTSSRVMRVECDTLSFRLSSQCFSDFLRFCLWLRGKTDQYLCREIQVNSKSGHVREIRNLLTSYNKGRMAAQKALSSMTPFGRAFVQSNPSHSPLFSAAISDKIEGRIKAYTKWKGLVAAGCPWDHKKAIQKLQGYKH